MTPISHASHSQMYMKRSPDASCRDAPTASLGPYGSMTHAADGYRLVVTPYYGRPRLFFNFTWL
jgi:hypothetical protein